MGLYGNGNGNGGDNDGTGNDGVFGSGIGMI